MDVDITKIKQLAELAQEKNLAEIEVKDGDKSVIIKTLSSVQAAAPVMVSHQGPPMALPQTFSPHPVAAPASNPVKDSTAEAPTSGVTITAPMVGTFYGAPSPESPPFVTAGQAVAKGQTLCIIEAMKLMNELESEVDGTVVKILVQNGQAIEYGQPLFLIEPKA